MNPKRVGPKLKENVMCGHKNPNDVGDYFWCKDCGAIRHKSLLSWVRPINYVDALADELLKKTSYPNIYSNGKGWIILFTEKSTNIVYKTRKGNLSDALCEALNMVKGEQP